MMTKRKISLIILLSLLSALCLFSLGMAWKEYAEQKQDQNAFEELAELVELPEETVAATETDADTEPEESEPAAVHKRNLAAVFEQNSECIGWLYIDGTAVDYPIMHTPEDPQKYLRRNFDDEYSVSGIPFLDYRCSLNTNLIIYGHNMKNGTMFSDLKKYLDEDFRIEHPTIELETADGVSYYTVTEVLTTDTSDEWYNRIETDGTQHLILSTCYGSSKSGRLLVIAEKI